MNLTPGILLSSIFMKAHIKLAKTYKCPLVVQFAYVNPTLYQYICLRSFNRVRHITTMTFDSFKFIISVKILTLLFDNTFVVLKQQKISQSNIHCAICFSNTAITLTHHVPIWKRQGLCTPPPH